MGPEQLKVLTAFLTVLKNWQVTFTEQKITINSVRIFVDDVEDAYEIVNDDAGGFYLSPGWPE